VVRRKKKRYLLLLLKILKKTKLYITNTNNGRPRRPGRLWNGKPER